MRPLQSVAMGLVVIVLTARFGGYDGLPDPVGWLLVLAGVAALPADLEHRPALLGLGALAGVVAVPLWVPSVVEALNDTDPSLAWAANLPQLAFTALLCRVLARRADATGDRRPGAWLRTATAGVVVVGVLPVLVFGAGVDALEEPSYVAGAVSVLLVIWLLFSYHARKWAGPPPVGTTPSAEPV